LLRNSDIQQKDLPTDVRNENLIKGTIGILDIEQVIGTQKQIDENQKL
jgi:hypothetical protein